MTYIYSEDISALRSESVVNSRPRLEKRVQTGQTHKQTRLKILAFAVGKNSNDADKWHYLVSQSVDNSRVAENHQRQRQQVGNQQE